MRTGIIYLWTNKINGKNYVGQTLNEHKRYLQHKNGERADSQYIDRAIIKNGAENFDYEILESFTGTKEEVKAKLDEAEIKYIKLYHSHVSEGGYNISRGGEGCMGYEHTEEAKKKLSEAKKGVKLSEKQKKAISEGHKGLVFSDEHKENLSRAQEQNKVRIIQLTLEGDKVAEYESIKEAQRETGINRGGISACLSGKQTKAGNYKWKAA